MILMTTRARRRLLGSLWWLLALPLAAAGPPHIVVFLVDDMSVSDSSPHHPASGIPTPNMQRLAAAGMTFTQAFVSSPSCAPSRASLLTGLNPVRHGAMFNHSVPDATVKSWPAYFREAGYETAAIGKVAHYHTGKRYGFDFLSHGGSREYECIRFATGWLEKRGGGDKPLCLLVGTHWPHTPWPESGGDGGGVFLPPTQVDTPETRRARADYAAAVESADVDLGLVMDAAVRHLGENVLFVFTSDHGSAFPFAKWNLYDDGIQTPLIVSWPGTVAAGSTSAALVGWIDLLPTLLEAAGAEPPPHGRDAGELSGRSFLGVMTGRRDDHREAIFATQSGDGEMNQYPSRAARTRDWKYIRNLAPEREHHTHIDKARGGAHDGGFWASWVARARDDDFAARMVRRYHQRPAEELYDLRADPWEMENLAGQPAHDARLSEMRRMLDEEMALEGDEGMTTEERRDPRRKR